MYIWKKCLIHDKWLEIRTMIYDILKNTTLDSFKEMKYHNRFFVNENSFLT
jgi:DNA-binding IscR family transcriptional regulator